MLDRIDLHVDVPPVPVTELSGLPDGERSEIVRSRVTGARTIQRKRFEACDANLDTNAQASGKILEKIAPLEPRAQEMLNKATDALKLSARGYHRIIRVARTIADLDGGTDIITPTYIAEALSYRRPRLH